MVTGAWLVSLEFEAAMLKPVAVLRRYEDRDVKAEPRRFGLWDGFGVSESFFETLPEHELDGFLGK